MKPIYPCDFQTIIYEIKSKHKWIDFIYDKIEKNQCERAPGNSTNVGYVMLENDVMQETFQPIFNRLEIDLKILSVYIHYTGENDSFAVHTHDKPHGVYYLQAPTNSGELTFPDFGKHFAPEVNRFRLIPTEVPHGIDIHHNKIERIVITMQLENPV